MISTYGSAAFLILGIAAAIAWRRRERSHDSCAPLVSKEDAFDSSTRVPYSGPAAREWCAVLEKTSDARALCFDDALCLVDAGPDGIALIREELGLVNDDRLAERIHLVDIVPACAISGMLELAARVRRGKSAERGIEWNGRNFKVTAAPLGKGWIAICISRDDRVNYSARGTG